ncbi:hypothetical protein CTI12_AA134410 [Artemisia annua]|uniref:Uncharacterized protein n=1 Tax=Artemisia annua TaxID=35608 RepID=A0A2U1PN43_ARTAN|nr:hypothetical protein CTI12_AA134410 [Artemisia annua]
MAGLQQFYFFPTDFLDTINKDHSSSPPLEVKDIDDGELRATRFTLRDSVNRNLKKVKISSDSLPKTRMMVPVQKQKKKVDP